MMDRVRAVALGNSPADILLKNGRVVDVLTETIYEADVAIAEGVIAGVGSYDKAEKIIDLKGAYVAPGLINAHCHVESSMAVPEHYCAEELRWGVTTLITDPHEIANVCGVTGIDYMIDASEGLPVDVHFMLPSCVPAMAFEENGEKLEEIKAAIKEIVKRIEDADGKLEDVTVTLDEVQQGLDDARRLYDEANAKLEELLGLYDKLVMLIKAKAMMDQAAETLKAGETEIGTAWYKLQQTKAGLADTEERLKNEKKQLIKDYNKLSEVDRTVDEYNDLTARQKAARTALVLYPDIKTRTEAGEDVAAAAQAVRDSMEKELEREFAGRLGISILCIAAGIFGILTLPAAFERMRTYPALRVFAILSLACAVGAECVGLFMGWGQTYAAVFGAIFALLVLLVGGRAKIAAV